MGGNNPVTSSQPAHRNTSLPTLKVITPNAAFSAVSCYCQFCCTTWSQRQPPARNVIIKLFKSLSSVFLSRGCKEDGIIENPRLLAAGPSGQPPGSSAEAGLPWNMLILRTQPRRS
jgi:hypothetical protein